MSTEEKALVRPDHKADEIHPHLLIVFCAALVAESGDMEAVSQCMDLAANLTGASPTARKKLGKAVYVELLKLNWGGRSDQDF